MTILFNQAEAEAPTGVFLGPEKPQNVENLIASYDWDWDSVLAIVDCESGGNPEAVGDTTTEYSSYGLFQIRALPGRPDPDWLKVPANNIEYAYGLWNETQSFNRHWVNCAKNIKY